MSADRIVRFEAIYDSFSGLILAYAARRTNNSHDALDVVADTFTIAWRRLDDVPPGDLARPWLYGVARRVLANHHRGNQRRLKLDDRVVAAAERSAPWADADVSGPDATVIAGVFSRLPERDREILGLLAWDGLAHDEIATVLGCSPATVRVRLHRARRRLSKMLEASGVQHPATSGHGSRSRAIAHADQENE